MTLHAHAIVRASQEAPVDFVQLTYEDRLIRRKRITTAGGLSFIVDLPETVGLDEGDAFVLEDGRHVVVMAADEDLMEVQGDLHRLAWHIGNRHAPCQIEMDRLVIRADKVMRDMLLGLGAVVKDLREPFRPEGGAYGHGRTMGHSHGAHSHDHAHEAGHDRLHGLMQGDAPAGAEDAGSAEDDGHHHHHDHGHGHDHHHDEVPNLRPHHHHDHKH